MVFSAYSTTFHLSLTVLVRYGSDDVFRLWRWSSNVRAGFHVSYLTRSNEDYLRDTRLSLSSAQLSSWFSHFGLHSNGQIRVRSPLLTESRLSSFPMATKMFQFTTFYPNQKLECSLRTGFPLGDRGVTAYYTSPRLSQFATSFFIIRREIHLLP